MNVRHAEPRDIPAIAAMFKKLLEFLEDKGQEMFNPDWKQRDNGIIAFISAKMTHEGNAVLVTDDDRGQPTGFLIGWVIYFPSFFKHQKVGEVQFMWPMSFDKAPYLGDFFDKWAQAQGCTGSSNFATPGHKTSLKVFTQRDGRKLTHYYFFKSYPQEANQNAKLDG